MLRSDNKENEEKCGMPSGIGVGDKHWRREEILEAEARTIDCLRGRLLAERVASKAAKEESDLMGKKLTELERQLKLELESRDRAEKKLKSAMKKLKSLKLSAVLRESSSPEKSEGSASSSNKKVSSILEKQKPGSRTVDSRVCNIDQMVGKTTEAALSNVEDSGTNNDSPSNSEQASELKDEHSCGESAKAADALGQSSMGREDLGKAEDEEEFTGDLSLAIVPATMWHEAKACEPQFNNETQFKNNTHDVLVALQRAKEHLQSSMERMALESLIPMSCVSCKRYYQH